MPIGKAVMPPLRLPGNLAEPARIFGTDLASIPATVSYLSADPQLADDWATRLVELEGFKVGMHWHGSVSGDSAISSHSAGRVRALAQLAGVTLVSLQKDGGREQIAELAGRFTVVDFGDELDGAHGPFMDTAAIMKNLDLDDHHRYRHGTPGRGVGCAGVGGAANWPASGAGSPIARTALGIPACGCSASSGSTTGAAPLARVAEELTAARQKASLRAEKYA